MNTLNPKTDSEGYWDKWKSYFEIKTVSDLIKMRLSNAIIS